MSRQIASPPNQTKHHFAQWANEFPNRIWVAIVTLIDTALLDRRKHFGHQTCTPMAAFLGTSLINPKHILAPIELL